MKNLFLLIVIVFSATFSTYSQSETTVYGHAYASLTITDDSWTSTDYYDGWLRIETTDPWSSGWVSIGHFAAPGPFSIDDITVSSVPYDPPIDHGYYSIRILLLKNQSQPGENNSATATPSTTQIEGHIRFDADNDIEVKFE
jgi:hypothetical protein